MEIEGFNVGIFLRNSSDTLISGNRITNNVEGAGIFLFRSCCGNNISGNIIATSGSGLMIYNSSLNRISGNTITANTYNGIWLGHSSNNVFRNNRMADNQHNMLVWGYTLSAFLNDIDTSNTVDGKPVYYWINKRSERVPVDAGYVVLVNCTDITVSNLNLNKNGEGIALAFTTNSTITENNVENNEYGILPLSSSNNNIYGNNIANNERGIYLINSSYNNIYHNNFIDNSRQVSYEWQGYILINTWDNGYPSGGNYWSDYVGYGEDNFSGPSQDQLGSDGIGDTPYIIDGNNQDRYPLMYCVDLRERILPSKAVELAKEVIGKGYGHTSQSEDVAGYMKVGENYRFLSSDEIGSLVCCGLIFWSYNKAYYDSIGRTMLTVEEFENRPVHSGRHASWQWKFNVNPKHMWKDVEKMNEVEIEEVIQAIEEDVRIGDLIFFDTDENGLMDHVVMFTEIRENEFYVIHAHDGTEHAGISEDTIDNLIRTYYWCAKNGIFKGLSIGVGQVIDYFELKIVGGSPIDLIVTDPDGEVITKDIGRTFDREYREFDIDGDGELNDIVTFRTRKKGNYLIQVVPEPEASPTDTYALKVEALTDDEITTVVLAEGVCINDTTTEPDRVSSTEIGITYWTDLNQDGTVNILDISIVAMAFGSTPEDPNWDVIADLNNDQIINILDISTVAIEFGKTV